MQWTRAIVELVEGIRASSEAAEREAICEEGIEILGWVAGHVHKHPISRQLCDDVGRSGRYYRVFNPANHSGLCHQESRAVGRRRAELYDSWFQRGEQTSFNEEGLLLQLLWLRRIADEVNQFAQRETDEQH